MSELQHGKEQGEWIIGEPEIAPPDMDWDQAWQDFNALGFLYTLAGQ